MHIRLHLTRAVAVLFWVNSTLALAQTTPIVRLECTQATFPSCGWSSLPDTSYATKRWVAGAGPQGQDVAQFDLVPSSTHSQFYLGWGTSVPVAPQGSTRYIRLRIRFLAPLNLTGNPPEGAWTDKFIILGDGSDSTSRVIVELRPTTSVSSVSTRIQRNIDGEPNRTSPVDLEANTWHSIQYEIRSSSASAANARLAFWLNGANANHGAPTAQSGSFVLNTHQWSNLNIGYYSNGSLAPNGRLSFQIAGAEYDDEFDPNWGSGTGQATPPSPPRNLRTSSGGR
ncbi:MAG: hypothetical protein ACKVPX_06005 [Myxococcaceae bacterium]